MTDAQGELNRLAGTIGLAAQAAANAWAGTTGLSLLAALNAKAGTSGLGFDGACNVAAGDTESGTLRHSGLHALQDAEVPPNTITATFGSKF